MRISITKKDEKYLEIDTLPQDVKRHVVKEAIKNYMQTEEYRTIIKTFGTPNNNRKSITMVDKINVAEDVNKEIQPVINMMEGNIIEDNAVDNQDTLMVNF